jgi:hypothetical protein
VLEALAARPEHVAVERGDHAVTGAELLSMIGTIAGGLRASGIGPGSGVAVAVELLGPVVYNPVTAAHSAGTAAVDIGTGITITPALSAAHPSDIAVNELGLMEPPLDTPMPVYWGFTVASLMTKPGATLTEITPSSTVRAYASYLDGTESICLINTDDTDPVTVQVDGLGNQGTLTTYGYGLENPAVVQGAARLSTAAAGLQPARSGSPRAQGLATIAR